MGFIVDLRSPPQRHPNAPALLLASIRAILHADLSSHPRERAVAAQLRRTVPELSGIDSDELEAAFERVTANTGDIEDVSAIASEDPHERLNAWVMVIERLRELPRELSRKKCFLLAVEIMMSSGIISPVREHLIEHMFHALGIAPDIAHEIVEVMSIKYGR